MADSAAASIHVELLGCELQDIPPSGLLVCFADYEYASSWLDASDLGRAFLIGAEMPPALLPRLEQHHMPGAMTALDLHNLRDLNAGGVRAVVRTTVAEALGYTRVPTFSSNAYAVFDVSLSLGQFLLEYLVEFEAVYGKSPGGAA